MQILLTEPPFSTHDWSVNWVWSPGPGSAFEAVWFAHTFQASDLPEPKQIHLSADNRYKLYLNGQLLGMGPACGDLHHWRYDSYDLSALLQDGTNVLAVLCWHDRDYAPGAQMSAKPGFMLTATNDTDRRISTGAGWRCRVMESWRVIPPDEVFMLAGPGHDVTGCTEADRCPSPEMIERDYVPVRVCERVNHAEAAIAPSPWRLRERTLPAMRYDPGSLGPPRPRPGQRTRNPRRVRDDPRRANRDAAAGSG